MSRGVIATPIAWAVLVVSQACNVGPDYEPPVSPMPDVWRSAVEDELSQEVPSIESWWDVLGDSTLTALIRRAEFQSLGLRASVARVQEARAIRGIATGGRLPDVFLGGSFTRTKLSENGIQGAAAPDPAVLSDPINVWSTSLDASWEIDVWGRVRRQVEAATAGLEASIEDYRDVLVTVYADVAANYVDARSFQTRIAFAEANAAAQRESLQLTRDRFNSGLTSALDVAQAESNLATTEAQIPAMRSVLAAVRNRLSVLLGEPPGAIDALLADSAGIPTPPGDVLTGVPIDLLRRRPDVRRAERLLAAQTAQIGVATADLYPRFSLTAFLGLESLDLGDLAKGPSITWGIVPGFSWNIFSAGKVKSNIQVEEARAEQALVAYEQSVLFAMEDVENAAMAFVEERTRLARLQEAVDASQRSVDLVRTQYLSGLTNFQNLLDTQRSLFQQQDQLASSQGQVVLNLIALNKALGGGWSPGGPDPDQRNGAEN
ncbi:MAG: efflux transporter outer membrane subunit [Gemmatimonadetes bacterium]|nr:efflux transporter outer membrane subunit [Gemmatimonadota bacterium]MCZ6918527.1 efflux transporter outer membrane subunit [Gemmatimonadota bacterium]